MAFAPHSSRTAARHEERARGVFGFFGSPSVATQLRLSTHLNARAAKRLAPYQLRAKGQLQGNLRHGIEGLSGHSMPDVSAHYNSAKPAQLNAEAYAQGRDIHLAPGKAHHLPPEAWHVAQQAQGRVKPTMQLQVDERAVQRAVPRNSALPKPAADTGTYKAIGGEKAAFDPAKHLRRQFDFGSKTREQVLKKHVRYELGDGTIESVRVATGTHENVGGVQLDHVYSWKNISKNMNERNKAVVGAKNTANAASWYSLWDAKMYYNDQTNLQPVLGSSNASAGAGGVKAAPKIKEKFALEIAEIHGSFMKLQRATNKVGKDPSAMKEGVIDTQLDNTKKAATTAATTIDAL